ncbi:MAG: hypothetical protein ACFCUT_13065 [Kiloniellaceae bacterium]
MRHLLTAALAALALCSSAAAQNDVTSGEGPESAARPSSGSLDIAEIASMPAGTWLHYGRPWRDIDPGRDANCGVDFGSVLGAWNGVVWDGRYVWSWAAGGHGDGCFNGIVRYDLQAGKPEMVVPHLPLNVPLCRPFVKASGESDCYWEPYASDEPFPGGMDERVAEWQHAFLRPRSSHTYNNTIMIDDWIYLPTGHIYGSSKPDSQVWRFHTKAADIAATIERLPDRFDPNAGPDRDRDGQPDGDQIGSYAVNWVQRPGKPPLMFSGSIVCQPDLLAGQYNCTSHDGISFSTSTTMAWDEKRQGIWAVDANRNRLTFIRENRGKWVVDGKLSVTDEAAINKDTIGPGGLCLVPTPEGANPVIWGRSGSLFRWDGQRLHIIDLPGGPGQARRSIYNKWTWNEDLEVCLGTWTVDEGFWAYKPDFAAGAAAVQTPPGLPPAPTPNTSLEKNPVSPPARANTPRPSQEPRPERTAGRNEPTDQNSAPTNAGGEQARNQKPPPADEPDQAINLKEQWWTDPAAYPTFAGHRVAPVSWQPAAWNQPIERQPEAPDYDALCPGQWAELNYRNDEDLANSAPQMRHIAGSGTPNVRVYLHPRVDATGQVIAYTNSIKFDKVQCSEIVGVPLNGEKPQTIGAVVASGTGVIARGIMFKGESVRWTGNRATNTYPSFVVLHDLDIYDAGHLMGDSPPKAPLTYLEFRGNVIGHNTDWHVIYLERSIGQLVALSNVFYGPGRANHAFKNLAHQSRIEGNVFSNVGIDGQVLEIDRKNRPVIGLMPLDLYLCTETVFRDNTVLFRTSDSVRTFMAYRGRRAWGNCDKGRRLDNGRWELWPPEDASYNDPARWAEINAATAAFDRGYEAAKAEPWLFTHKVEGNHFIVFNALERDGEPFDDTRAASAVSLRPVAENPIRAKLNEESRALAQRCAEVEDRTACVLAGMSPGLRYAYDHISPGNRDTVVANGDLPRGVPIPAPEGWVERSGIFWGSNQFITCSADGRDCRQTEPRPVDASPRPWDELEVAHPPRVIKQ